MQIRSRTFAALSAFAFFALLGATTPLTATARPVAPQAAAHSQTTTSPRTPAQADRSETERYAKRDQQAKKQKDYKGGLSLVIGISGGALLIIIIVLILLL